MEIALHVISSYTWFLLDRFSFFLSQRKQNFTKIGHIFIQGLKILNILKKRKKETGEEDKLTKIKRPYSLQKPYLGGFEPTANAKALVGVVGSHA